jgi:hypothetical protein
VLFRNAYSRFKPSRNREIEIGDVTASIFRQMFSSRFLPGGKSVAENQPSTTFLKFALALRVFSTSSSVQLLFEASDTRDPDPDDDSARIIVELLHELDRQRKMLTPEEIEALRRDKKETAAWARKAYKLGRRLR